MNLTKLPAIGSSPGSYGGFTVTFLICIGTVLFPLSVKSEISSEAGDKDFVGKEVCATCHKFTAEHWAHTVHAKVFNLNPRDKLEARSCEACHGPGSKHINDPSNPDKIIRFTYGTETPVIERNEVCRQCHSGGDQIHWAGSVHERHNIACTDCHNPMAKFSDAGLLTRKSVNETCFMCHQEQRSQFLRRSHMPLFEGKISCIDCHNPHGSTTKYLLKADSVNETCYQCHAEKRGPFLFEHAPVTENCLNCHTPHGSNHEKLLVTARPILCQQCHTAIGHVNDLITRANLASADFPDPRVVGRSCQNCHAQIHGSNNPSGPRFHR